MLNTQHNLESILQYRPSWTDEDKTTYVDNLNYINDNYDKLLLVHHEIIANSIYRFDYVTDSIADFIVSYLRGK